MTRREKNIYSPSSRRPRHKFLDSACDFCYNDEKRVEKCTFLYMAAKGVDNHAQKDHGLQEHTSAAAGGGIDGKANALPVCVVRNMLLKRKAG